MKRDVLPPEFPIIDGFHYKTSFKCNLTFLSLAVGAYEDLRRSGAFRTKAWPVPKDSHAIAIPAFDAYEYNLDVVPGSAIWGYTLTSGTQPNSESSVGGISFTVRDSCNDVGISPEAILKPQAELTNKQQLLAKLMVVGDPGMLNIEICNTNSSDQHVQLILYGGEPAWR